MNCEKCVKSTKEKLVIHMHTHKYTIFMSSGATCHCFKKSEELYHGGKGNKARGAWKQY